MAPVRHQFSDIDGLRQTAQMSGLRREMVFELIRLAGDRVRGGAVTFHVSAQQHRAPPDAVDAHDKIQDRAPQRHQPDESHPAGKLLPTQRTAARESRL